MAASTWPRHELWQMRLTLLIGFGGMLIGLVGIVALWAV
jgi:hypothetical protein